MTNSRNNEDFVGRSAYFRDARYFSVIVFIISLMTATLINTQENMKQLAALLASFGLGYLIIGIASQLIRMRDKK